MNRQEIVRKVAEKLNISEDVVDDVFMHQTQAITEKLRDPDVTLIFVPELGSFSFRFSKATDKMVNRMRIRQLVINKLYRPNQSERLIRHLVRKANEISQQITLLKYKVSNTPDKYGGIRLRNINRGLDGAYNGQYRPVVDELRKQRQDGFTPEIISEQDFISPEQGGSDQGLPEILSTPLDDQQGTIQQEIGDLQE